MEQRTHFVRMHSPTALVDGVQDLRPAVEEFEEFFVSTNVVSRHKTNNAPADRSRDRRAVVSQFRWKQNFISMYLTYPDFRASQ